MRAAAMLALCGCDGVLGLSATVAADASSSIQFVQPVVQQFKYGFPEATFATDVKSVGDAIVVAVICAFPTGAAPSGVSVTSPGWTFAAISPITVSPGNDGYIASVGAIAPIAGAVQLDVTWQGPTACNGLAVLGSEFANADPTGGATTFDAHAEAPGGPGDCVGAVTTAHADDAVWAACLPLGGKATSVGPGFVEAADDTGGDLAEYKLMVGPVGTVQVVTFSVESTSTESVMSVVAIRPR